MYVIAGLGNPGSKYEKTRHNVGFQVIDRLASKYHIDMKTQGHLRNRCDRGCEGAAGETSDLHELKWREYQGSS